MAARQRFLGDDADVSDPFASMVGGLPLPTFDSPVGDTNEQSGAQQPPPTFDPSQLPPPDVGVGTTGASGQKTAVTDPRVTATSTPPAPVTYGQPITPGRSAQSVSVPAGDPSWKQPHTAIGNLLNEGNFPQQVVDQINKQFGLKPGSQAVYYPPGTHGPNDLGTIGLPEGYWALNQDGSWGWNPRMEGTTGPTVPPRGTTGGGGGAGLTNPQFQTLSTPVGTDPFSQSITGGLTDLIQHGGLTPEEESLFGTLSSIISSGGRLPNDASIDQANLERAREDESRAFTGQLADTRDELAARGLVSQPGAPQGEEASAINRINQNIAPAYAQAVRDISTASAERQNQRVSQALTTITGLSESAANNLLGALGKGTERQSALAKIALDSLDQNIQWNEFLANYGLTRDQIQFQIEQGNIASILPILSLFSQLVGHTTGGFV